MTELSGLDDAPDAKSKGEGATTADWINLSTPVTTWNDDEDRTAWPGHGESKPAWVW